MAQKQLTIPNQNVHLREKISSHLLGLQRIWTYFEGSNADGVGQGRHQTRAVHQTELHLNARQCTNFGFEVPAFRWAHGNRPWRRPL